MSLKHNICPDCFEEEEEVLASVKQYLKDNPNESLDHVADAVGAPKTLIMKFLRQKRLTVTKGSALTVTCSSCGNPISSGRLCEHCQSQATREAKRLGEKNTGKSSSSSSEGKAMPRRNRRESEDSHIKSRFRRG